MNVQYSMSYIEAVTAKPNKDVDAHQELVDSEANDAIHPGEDEAFSFVALHTNK